MNMKRMTVVCVAAVALTGSAWAQGKAAQPAQPAQPAAQPAQPAQPAQAPAMDMTKMGPWARKPTNEKQTKQEIMAFFKAQEDAMKKGDMEASFSAIDYPVFMVTDDQKGMPESKAYGREEYVAMMRPMLEGMPKDTKMTHKPTITVLSDSLASVVDDFSMTMNKQTVKGRNAGLLVKRDGKWLWKMMVEAGWGGMSSASGSAPMPTEGKK